MEIEFTNDCEKLFFEISKNLAKDNFEKTKNESLNPAIYKKEEENFCFYIVENKKLIAGITGKIDFYNWMNVELLWVDKKFRNQGLGSKLINEIKNFAINKSCVGIRLTTWDFQAEEFYKKHGFEKFGELRDYPKGVARIFMCCYL